MVHFFRKAELKNFMAAEIMFWRFDSPVSKVFDNFNYGF